MTQSAAGKLVLSLIRLNKHMLRFNMEESESGRFAINAFISLWKKIGFSRWNIFLIVFIVHKFGHISQCIITTFDYRPNKKKKEIY